jgi:ABC-2 type transport system permease protein
MNRNLFLKEMKRNALSLTVWMIIVTFLISLTMAVYPTFMENQSKVLGMLSLVPKSAMAFKGVGNISDLLSVMGFYAANNVIYMMVLGSIFAIVLSSNILLKEEYNKTAEYLLAWPVTRSEVFMSKAALLFLNIFLLNLVTSLAGFIWLEVVKDGPFSIKAFLILSLYTLLLNIFFGTAGLLLSTLIKKPRPITALSIGLVLIFYFIYTISKITESAAKFGYLSPFRYVRTDATSPDYNLDLLHLFGFITASLFLAWFSYRLYKHKDIYI